MGIGCRTLHWRVCGMGGGVYGDWMPHITLEGLWFMWIGCHTLHWRVCGMGRSWACWSLCGLDVTHYIGGFVEWGGVEMLEFMWIGCHTLHWRVCGIGRSWSCGVYVCRTLHWRVCGMGRSLWGLDATHYIGGFVEWGGVDSVGVYGDWMPYITLEGLWNEELMFCSAVWMVCTLFSLIEFRHFWIIQSCEFMPGFPKRFNPLTPFI